MSSAPSLFQDDLVRDMQAERISNNGQSCARPYFTLRMSLMTCIYVAWQVPSHLLPKLQDAQILQGFCTNGRIAVGSFLSVAVCTEGSQYL